MAGLGDLTAQSLGSSKAFNWTWFIELITAGILVIWFFFYSNRLLATIISWAIRFYTWHTFRVYIDIQAIQVSLLGGRVFFKGIRYHGQNETIYVHSGHLTWRYWLQSTRQIDLIREGSKKGQQLDSGHDDDDDDSEESLGKKVPQTEKKTRRKHPKETSSDARLLVSVTGLEWFIYNRTPVYDSIIKTAEEGVLPASKSPEASRASTAIPKAVEKKLLRKVKLRKTSTDEEKLSDVDDGDGDDEDGNSIDRPEIEGQTRSSVDTRGSASTHQDTEIEASDIGSFYTLILKFMPLAIECARGSISLGNEHTKAIIVTTFEKARGHVDAGASGPADIFKQIFAFDVTHPLVQMRPNPDYNLPQLAAAERIISGSGAVLQRRHWWKLNLDIRRRKRNLTQGLRNLVPGFHKSVESFHGGSSQGKIDDAYAPYGTVQPDSANWHGLDRYIDEDDADDHHAWMNIEYARFSTILDCPRVQVKFYWDTPGKVKIEHLEGQNTGLAKDINGIEPPAYGLDLDVYGGTVNYGPWTDRMRAELQSIFLPSGYKSAIPALRLLTGQTRQSSRMDINVHVHDEITLRIPVRESSKDWRWRGRAMAVRDAAALRKQQERRHFRFRRGNKRRLGPEIRPFGWFSVSVGRRSTVSYVMDMFSGYDGYRNDLQLRLKDTKASSSVNHAPLWRCREQNIRCNLSNPINWNDLHNWRFDLDNQDMDLFLLRDHTFLLIDLISDFTSGLKSDYMTFMPFQYDIGVGFHNFKLFLNANDYNIIDNPTELDENTFLILGFEQLDGEVSIPMKFFSPSQSSVHFEGSGSNASLTLKTPLWNTLHTFAEDETMATLKTLGLQGVYNYQAGTSPELTDSLFMNIVGGHPKFQLQGFLIRYFMNVKENYFGDYVHFKTLEEYQNRLDSENHPGSSDRKAPPKKQNDLDVILSVRADTSVVLMPANIYERAHNVRVDVLLVEADMRFTNYYMDLQVNTSPVEVFKETETSGDGKKTSDTTSCQLFVDGIAIYGHRLFGAPPTEPTYVCNWDFDIGHITGECSTEFIQTTIGAVLAFVFTMDDDENALPQNEVLLPDITFLRARATGVTLWLVSSDTAFLLDIAPTNISLNDWAKTHFSKEIQVNVPSMMLAAVDARSAYRKRDMADQKVETLACITAAVKLSVLNKKANFAISRAKQQQHVRFHDQRTHRTDWLLQPQLRAAQGLSGGEWARRPPAMPVPDMPEPMVVDSRNNRSEGKSSFRDTRIQNNTRIHQNRATLLASERFMNKHEELLKVDKPFADARAEKRESLLPPNTVSISSPWVAPQFPLQKVRPDMSYMPQIPSSKSFSNPILSNSLGSIGSDDDNDDESTKHDGVFCNFVHGLRGFCTPELFHALAQLLSDLAPKTPTDILDIIQMKTVSNIKALTIEKLQNVDDIAIHLPYARVSMYSCIVPTPAETAFDRFDFELNKASLTMRIAPRPHRKAISDVGAQDLLLYTSIESIGASVSEVRPIQPISKASARLLTSDIGLWLTMQASKRAKVQINAVNIDIIERDINRLADLIYRSEIMLMSIAKDIETVEPKKEMQNVLYRLTRNEESPEPPFLSRPSYVLRTANEHVRLNESWKIMSKLRNVWLFQRKRVDQGLTNNDTDVRDKTSEEVRRQVLSAFDEWKSWGGFHNADGPIRKAIFGTTEARRQTLDEEDEDTEAEILLSRAAITLDPGPHQSEFSLHNVDLNFSEKSIKQSMEGWNVPTMSKPRRITVQSYLGDMTLKLNWGLLELVESVVRKISSSPSRAPAEASEMNPSVSRSGVDYVILIGMDSSALQINTLNLRLSSGMENFRASFMIMPHPNDQSEISVMTNASSARLSLSNDRKAFFGWKLLSPSLYASTSEISELESRRRNIRLAATCKRLRFSMKQDFLELLKATKRVLREEVPVIQRIITGTESTNVLKADTETVQQLNLPDAHIALLLNDYKLDLALLPYLHYTIAGRVARTSILPRSASRFTIDMDLKESFHYFENTRSARYNKVPSLQLPPLNARVSVSLLPDRIIVYPLTTMELIRLEASAVRACFDAAYQPKTEEYMKEVKRAMKDVELLVTESVPRSNRVSDKDQEKKPSRLIQYSGHAVLAGFELTGDVPAARKDEHYRAEVLFILGQTSIAVHNERTDHGEIFAQPQIDFRVRDVTVYLGRNTNKREQNGRMSISIHVTARTDSAEDGSEIQKYQILSNGVEFDLFEETAILATDLSTFLQQRIKNLIDSDNGKKLQPLRRMTLSSAERVISTDPGADQDTSLLPDTLMTSVYAVDVHAIRIRWILTEQDQSSAKRPLHTLIFSIEHIDLKTRREGSGQLAIRGMQLQIVPKSSKDPLQRSASSALLPEMVFNAAHFATKSDRRFAFKAAGKAVDVRLAADFIIPASMIQKSLARASLELRSLQKSSPKEETEVSQSQLPRILGKKRLASLLVYADFAGTVVTITPRREENTQSAFGFLKGPKRSRAGRYGQAVQSGASDEATLRAPGIAFKIEYRDNGTEDPTLSTEIKVAASSNTLAPSVVPLLQEISSSVTDIMGQDNDNKAKVEKKEYSSPSKGLTSSEMVEVGNPAAILGRVKLNAGLWIQKQEFGLTCQPIARVSATAKFDEIFVTVNTVQPQDQDRFFSIMTTFRNLSTSVQHVYSRESTASFEVESIVMSLMNSKHFSDRSGLSAILDISPMKADVNAKQLQDFLLFREIWYPEELRGQSKPPVVPQEDSGSQANAIQRFQEMSATAAVPWHAIASISELQFQVDFGQSLGKSNFIVSKLWASSKKTSESEQNLCIGFNKVGVDSTGRMSGFVELQNFRVRTAIKWPRIDNVVQAPLVQGSVGFEHLRAKTAFDYQPFGVADISAFELLMYNVRDRNSETSDRLVAILDGGKVQGFFTTSAAAQGLAIFQAFERLIQEKQEAYKSSLHELDRYLRRRSVFPSGNWGTGADADDDTKGDAAPQVLTASLNTDVVITIKAIDLGAFPSTFFDQQILKVEAVDVQARFAVGQEAQNKVHSGLGMSLGQVGVALSNVSRPTAKALGEVSVPEIIERATTSRGGTILRVPRLVASMQTWQQANSQVIEYVFRSVFQGKVDVGWNYSRISFIRTMWENHSRALAHRMGKPLAPSALKITAEPEGTGAGGVGKEKITAVVNMPQSRYEYVPLEPPIIDTPQLRDLGEATPSLEWIGLHREKLPNVTHSVMIVTLLELAREIEDSYHRILGST